MKRSICWSKSLSENKAIEIELTHSEYDEWFEFSLRTRRKQDHGGIGFTFALLTLFTFDINFYDKRHWNYEENRWYKYNEEEPY